MFRSGIFFTLVLLLGRSSETGEERDTDDYDEYFCSRSGIVEIPEQTEGRIITLFKGNSYYENNQFCQWNLHAGSEHRLQIVVDQWQLQYAPPSALCDGYDHIKVTDNEGFLVSWCQILPIFQSPFYLNSRGPNLTIFFQSDSTTPKNQRYRGGRLSFRFFDSDECPPNWISHEDTCFTLKRVTQIWSDAQKTCNFEQANLASIKSEEEFDFLRKSYTSFSGKVWFGLNDKSVFGTFKWMDNSSADGAFKAMDSLKADPFKHCGLVDFKKETVKIASCEEEAAVLCRTAKGDLSKIYPIPLFKTDKGSEEDTKTSRRFLLGVLIPCICVLFLIVLAVLLYRYRAKFSCITKEQNAGKRSDVRTRGEHFSLTQPSAPEICDELYPPRQASSQHIAPPTYEEALQSDPI